MRVAVLSPHRDDAAFSCGLVLAALAAAGTGLTIVNVCTVSRYAPYLTQEDGDRTRHVTDARRNEDESYVDLLTRSVGVERDRVSLLDLAWHDVPLRWQTDDHHSLAPCPLLADEIQTLANALRTIPSHDLVFAPLAVGGHVDHRLVRQAAMQAFDSTSLVFYEDLPYGCRLTEADAASLPLPFTPLCEAWLPEASSPVSKRAAGLCYPSQIASGVADEMEHYAAEHGGRERYVASEDAMHRLRGTLAMQGVSE